jgi:hypothetical protein
MTANRSIVGFAGPALPFVRALIAVLLLLPIAAAADVALYQAAVPLKGLTEADRSAAFGEALKVAAVRASGRRDAGAAPAIAAAAADPQRYIQQYSTTTDRMLKVGFDGRAMENLLSQAGLPLWPAERPPTLVLLFTPGIAAGGRAVTAAERPAERAEIERAAQIRGIPLAWPAETVDPAAARARVAATGSTAAVLSGVSSGTAGDWTFAHAGQTSRLQGGAAAGVGLAADTLAARYATGATRGVSSVSIRIGGLDGISGYAALTRYLEGLSLVRSASPGELAGGTVLFELAVRGDLELLRRIFAIDGRLTAAPRTATPAPGDPDFIWTP